MGLQARLAALVAVCCSCGCARAGFLDPARPPLSAVAALESRLPDDGRRLRFLERDDAFASIAVTTPAKLQWISDAEGSAGGVLQLNANRSLRVGVDAGEERPGARLSLSHADAHETFAFRDGGIKLQADPTVCLGAEGSLLQSGARVVAQPCERGAAHQGFAIGRDGRIRADYANNICMQAQGHALGLGVPVVLGPCRGVLSSTFNMLGGKIVVREGSFSDLHFNIEGGAARGPVVLWKSAPSAADSLEWLASGQLRLQSRRNTCLVAERGLVPGSRIVGAPCSEEDSTWERGVFVYDASRRAVRAKAERSLAFSVRGGAAGPSDEIVLGLLGEGARPGRTASGGDQEL